MIQKYIYNNNNNLYDKYFSKLHDKVGDQGINYEVIFFNIYWVFFFYIDMNKCES